jgi:hypothetical protein
MFAFAAVTQYHPDNGIAGKARGALEELTAKHSMPDGDPLVALKAETGRSRTLALAEVVDVPGLEPKRNPPTGPALGGAPDAGPFGGRY